MRSIALSLIAIGIVIGILMPATLPTPAQAFWFDMPDNGMFGALWDNPGDWDLRHEGIYGDTYVSTVSTRGWIDKEFVALLDWGISYPSYVNYNVWVDVGYSHYRSRTPREFVMWKAGQYDIIHTRDHGYISYNQYRDYFIMRNGYYWEVFLGGGMEEQICLPGYDEAAIFAQMSSTRNDGDLNGYWRNMKELDPDDGYWTYWNYQREARNFNVVVYTLNEHTWGCYNKTW